MKNRMTMEQANIIVNEMEMRLTMLGVIIHVDDLHGITDRFLDIMIEEIDKTNEKDKEWEEITDQFKTGLIAYSLTRFLREKGTLHTVTLGTLSDLSGYLKTVIEQLEKGGEYIQ